MRERARVEAHCRGPESEMESLAGQTIKLRALEQTIKLLQQQPLAAQQQQQQQKMCPIWPAEPAKGGQWPAQPVHEVSKSARDYEYRRRKRGLSSHVASARAAKSISNCASLSRAL